MPADEHDDSLVPKQHGCDGQPPAPREKWADSEYEPEAIASASSETERASADETPAVRSTSNWTAILQELGDPPARCTLWKKRRCKAGSACRFTHESSDVFFDGGAMANGCSSSFLVACSRRWPGDVGNGLYETYFNAETTLLKCEPTGRLWNGIGARRLVRLALLPGTKPGDLEEAITHTLSEHFEELNRRDAEKQEKKKKAWKRPRWCCGEGEHACFGDACSFGPIAA